MRGLTLTEMIVSTFLFLLVVVLVLNLVPSSMLGLAQGEHRTRADALAQSQLNLARARPFSSLVVGSETAPYQQDDYTWSLAVGRVDGAQAGRVRTLQVKVSWRERGQLRSLVREVWVCNVTR